MMKLQKVLLTIMLSLLYSVPFVNATPTIKNQKIHILCMSNYYEDGQCEHKWEDTYSLNRVTQYIHSEEKEIIWVQEGVLEFQSMAPIFSSIDGTHQSAQVKASKGMLFIVKGKHNYMVNGTGTFRTHIITQP